jgi:hypothetical protein
VTTWRVWAVDRAGSPRDVLVTTDPRVALGRLDSARATDREKCRANNWRMNLVFGISEDGDEESGNVEDRLREMVEEDQ